ncbi:MAG: glycoside hydrolase, partial [Nitrococcus sp.]|nr:glycoside hydrolase [Nitrococcus sp.]
MPVGEDGANLFLKRSADGGKIWSKPVQVSKSGQVLAFEASPQQMAIGPNGEVYVVWANNYTENNPYQYGKGVVMFARSTDRGKTFDLPVSVGPDVNDTETSRNFQNIAVAPDGTIYVSVLHSENAKVDDRGRSVRVISSEDGGQTWSTGSLVSKGTCPCCRTSLAASTDGNVYVGWRQIDSSGDTTIRDTVVAQSSDGGKTWTQPVEYYDDQWKINGCPHAGPSLTLDGRGRLHATWFTGAEGRLGIYHAISTDNGQSWSEPTPVFTPSYTPVTEPEMLVDAKGNAWIAFNDLRTPNGEKENGHSGGQHGGHGSHAGPAKVKIVEITADGETLTFPDLDINGRGADFAELENSIALVWQAQTGGIYFSTFQE